MAKRDDLFRQFGPILLEALFKDLFENIRELRHATGQPERTYEDFLDEVTSRMPEIPPYDWMSGT